MQVPIGGVPARAPAASPTALVSRRLPLRRGDEALVASLAGQLLGQAGELGEHAVVGASVAPRPTAPLLIERLAPLVHDAALVALIGANVQLAGAHIGPVEEHEPIAREWNLAVLGPYFAGALVARLVEDGPDGTVDFALTHDPDIVVDVAAHLLARAIN